MNKMNMEETEIGILVNSLRYSVNFDFEKAKDILHDLDKGKDSEEIVALRKNLQKLVEGDPEAMFSELLWNLKFQIVGEEFIDFVGRVFRFKEAVLKYIFVKETEERRILFSNDMMSKRNIMKNLRNKQKIYNSNLSFAITEFIGKHRSKNDVLMGVMKEINSEKMDNLIELRHESLVGHGFKGVTAMDIYNAYGNPYDIIDDFSSILRRLGIKVDKYKYSRINEYLTRRIYDEYREELKEEFEDDFDII